MPFTLFHLGPAVALGLPLRKYIHAPTFIVANVILDVEPFIVMALRLSYPLHGYLHTFLAALFVGLLLGGVIFLLEKFFQPIFRMFLLETDKRRGFKTFVISGALGTSLHILFDAPLYWDIHPFFPLTANPLLGAGGLGQTSLYALCVWMGIFGVAFYVGLFVFNVYKKYLAQKHQRIKGEYTHKLGKHINRQLSLS